MKEIDMQESDRISYNGAAYSPQQTASIIEYKAVTRARLCAKQTFVLSILAGIFVASGFEHCVANMYFIPTGIVLRKNSGVVAAAEEMAGKALDLSQLTWKGFFVNNLFPVTLGNFVGGVVLAGVAFWFAYLRPNSGYSPLGVKPDFPGDKR